MDPDACLKELVEEIQGCRYCSYDRAVDLLTALVDWLQKGGFDPLPQGGLDWVTVLGGALVVLRDIDEDDSLQGEEYLLNAIRALITEVDEVDSETALVVDGLKRLRDAVVCW